jgi:hypothetical protein
MPSHASCQLISYIAPAAPATRRPATGDEPFLRPEIGFTPNWYRHALGIDFGQRWHTGPEYRRETTLAMREELARRFPGIPIGGGDLSDYPLDLLTGAFGANVISSIYGIPIVYAPDNWPNCIHQYLTDEEADRLEAPDLAKNEFFQRLLDQVEWIAAKEGRIEGFLNWQGILNNAQRLRGEELFVDMLTRPDRARRVFDAVCGTMIQGCRLLRERQGDSGVDLDFFTVSNCLVNMVSAETYHDLLRPYDLRLAEEFGRIGIHNCAWNADPYIEDYAEAPGLAYIDMGLESDLERAREKIPHARRALMYTPMDLARKPIEELRADLERIAREYGACDLVAADIEAGTPDERVWELVRICEEITETFGS